MQKNVLEWWAYMIQNNPGLILFLFCISVLGFIFTSIALIYTIKQSKRKTLCFSYQSNELVGGKLSEVDELDISFRGKKIKNLTVTSVELFNNGNGAIEPPDFNIGREVKIVPYDSTQILFAKVISPDKNDPDQTINCKEPTIIEGKVCVNFDCLREKEKILLNIYHSGTRSLKFKIDAKLKEGNVVNATYIMDERKKTSKKMIANLAESLLPINIVKELDNN